MRLDDDGSKSRVDPISTVSKDAEDVLPSSTVSTKCIMRPSSESELGLDESDCVSEAFTGYARFGVKGSGTDVVAGRIKVHCVRLVGGGWNHEVARALVCLRRNR